MKSVEIRLEVPFHDVDVMGVVWHGHYAKYLELARCALLDSFDYNYPQMKDSGYAWPIIDLRVKYVKPLRFQQKIVVAAELVEWENRLSIRYLIRDAATGKRLAVGSTSQAAVDIKNGELCLVSPPIVFKKLGLPVP